MSRLITSFQNKMVKATICRYIGTSTGLYQQVQTQPECKLHLQSYTCPLVGVKSSVKECNMAMHIILKDRISPAAWRQTLTLDTNVIVLASKHLGKITF